MWVRLQEFSWQKLVSSASTANSGILPLQIDPHTFRSLWSFDQQPIYLRPRYTKPPNRRYNQGIYHLCTNRHQQHPLGARKHFWHLSKALNLHICPTISNEWFDEQIGLFHRIYLSILTTCWFVLLNNPWANTETTKTLIRNDTNRARPDSMRKYMFASRTLFVSRRSTSRDCQVNQNSVETWASNVDYVKRWGNIHLNQCRM